MLRFCDSTTWNTVQIRLCQSIDLTLVKDIMKKNITTVNKKLVHLLSVDLMLVKEEYRHCDKKLVRLLFDFSVIQRVLSKHSVRQLLITRCDGRTLLITWQQVWYDAKSNSRLY